MVNNEIIINRGDTYSKTFNFLDSDLNLFDATGWTAYFTVRKNKPNTSTSSDNDALISKTIPGTLSGATTFLLTSDDTNIESGEYFYDFQVNSPSDTVESTMSKGFIIRADITRTP